MRRWGATPSVAALLLLLALGACAHPEPASAPPPAAPAFSPPPAGTPVAAQALQSASPRPTINAAGLALIKESEGLHLKAYRDRGAWFIGYGHAVTAVPGRSITEDEAERLLRSDLALCETKMAAALSRPVTDNQFSALVSLCYNAGWKPVTASRIITHLKAGKVQAAADRFLDWTKVTRNGVKVADARLIARRQKERALFLAE